MGREDDRDRSGFPFGDEAQTPFDATRFESRLRDLDATASFSFPDEQVPADFGRSAVLLPFWREGDEVAVAHIDLAETTRYKDTLFDFARYRRPEVYSAITGQAGAVAPSTRGSNDRG